MSDNDKPIADTDPRDLDRICLMSAISGTLMRDGQPVKQALIKQSVSRVYSEGFVEKETMTDDEGYFEFPAIFEDKKPFVMLPVFRIGQSLDVVVNNQDINFWLGIKTDGYENSEARSKKLDVICNLNQEDIRVYIDNSNYVTLCHWDVISDPEPEPY